MTYHIYCEIVGWQKNLFMVLQGKAGKDFILELTRLINLFNFKTDWMDLSLSLVHIFLPIMLQKPHNRSKPRDNYKYLHNRSIKWADGDLEGLMSEMGEIQKRFCAKVVSEKESRDKAFNRLMFTGQSPKIHRQR
jgi:hypothetical protein